MTRREHVDKDWNWNQTIDHIQAACVQDAAKSLRRIDTTLGLILQRLDALGSDGLHQVIRAHRADLNRAKRERAAKNRLEREAKR